MERLRATYELLVTLFSVYDLCALGHVLTQNEARFHREDVHLCLLKEEALHRGMS